MIGIVVLALASAATPTGIPTPNCAAARRAVPTAGACVASAYGVALSADEASARALLSEALIAEQRFRKTFGREPAPYAVFAFDDPAAPKTAGPNLRKLGFRAVLPLPSPALVQRQMAEAASRLQPPAAGGVPPQIVRREGGLSGGEPRGENLIPHELGHQWYAAAFWSDAPAPTAPRYGSAAPDWLDEAAAMLMENEAGARGYHQMIADGRSADAARAATIPPEITLVELTSMTHPAMVNMPTGATPGGGPITVRARPSLFYPQVRVFVDYLAERSGDPRILAAVSHGLRDGTTFDAWLRAHGAKHELPGSLAAMQTDWNAWLDRGFGSAPLDR